MNRVGDDLLDRFRAGDRAAQREVCERLLPRLRRTVRTLVRQREDLEDTVQLCIIDILRSANGFRGDSSIETWAHRIAVRRALKTVGKRRLGLSRTEDGADLTTLPAPVEHSLGDRLPRHVSEYLDALPELQRQAIVLHHAWGYSLREVGELCGTSANTIKARLFHGLKKVRTLIAKDSESRHVNDA